MIVPSLLEDANPRMNIIVSSPTGVHCSHPQNAINAADPGATITLLAQTPSAGHRYSAVESVWLGGAFVNPGKGAQGIGISAL